MTLNANCQLLPEQGEQFLAMLYGKRSGAEYELENNQKNRQYNGNLFDQCISITLRVPSSRSAHVIHLSNVERLLDQAKPATTHTLTHTLKWRSHHQGKFHLGQGDITSSPFLSSKVIHACMHTLRQIRHAEAEPWQLHCRREGRMVDIEMTQGI